MKRTGLRAVVAVTAVVGALGLVGSGSAGPPAKTVCTKNCAFTSIQAAIDAASPGDTITIGPGKYVENLVVDRPLTLQGSGDGTVLYPALSGPVCAGGSLCAGGSNMILVQADDVTITNMRLEGDNPGLTSGVVAGGADLDARNGIIEDFNAGVFDNLTVSRVKVSDIYLRGIYASTGGTFTFTQDTVDNVQADPASIAMFNLRGSGVFSDNKVSNANDAISSNWSTGTQYVDNEISRSLSGIHTDNNGGSGGSADTISGNTVRDCGTDGYGIWVFAPYLSATADSNKVEGCYVGLALFGSQVSGQGPTFSNNDVKAGGAKTTDPDGTYGAYVITDLLGYGSGDATATFTGNSFEHFGTGLFVSETTTFYGDPIGGDATVTAHGNSFHDDGVGANGDVGTVVDAESNYWGCKEGPNQKPNCDTAVGTVDFTPWLTKKPKP
jgi:nitrous oxidase accessory protein NosD